MTVFADLAAEGTYLAAGYHLAPRKVPEHAVLTSRATMQALDRGVVIPRQPGLSEFPALVRAWPDHQFAVDVLTRMGDRDVQRAAQPPVLQVTVTPPAGTPGPPPGQYEVRTGPNSQVVSFRPSPALTLRDTQTDLRVITDAPVRRRGRFMRFLHYLGIVDW